MPVLLMLYDVVRVVPTRWSSDDGVDYDYILIIGRISLVVLLLRHFFLTRKLAKATDTCACDT